ncbi:acyl-CoA hydrolase [Salsuginibacillus halophilus]|uniref:Acyl-CoA hydrolase n=1 Tax=Salsuginibacillus halophilus TaxID=517424 RepID=A0A2P8HW16_9BACI|nr:acyl-CoA thioesterase [Salsuginibacillus halophilus]PSL50437.1 acyl-CoA hydrolase [Salsuginibacillus halophilus]
MDKRKVIESRVVQTDLVLPHDTNNHQTLFGGILMKRVDAVASIAARRHCREEVVTASTDSVDFLHPIRPTDSVCLEAFVSWTGKTSMEVFVKVTAENLETGERNIAATAFLTFVAVGSDGKPVNVPGVIPETQEEKKLYETGAGRSDVRKQRRNESKELANFITVNKPWE